MPLHLRIVTPRRVAFDQTVLDVRAPGFLGEFGALEGHERYLSAVRPGRVQVSLEEGEQVFVVGAGFVEVGPDHVILLSDHCEAVGSVSAEQAREELQEAEKRLTGLQEGSAAWAEAERRADLARARLG